MVTADDGSSADDQPAATPSAVWLDETDGDDANDGLAPGRPVKSWRRVNEIMRRHTGLPVRNPATHRTSAQIVAGLVRDGNATADLLPNGHRLDGW